VKQEEKVVRKEERKEDNYGITVSERITKKRKKKRGEPLLLHERKKRERRGKRGNSDPAAVSERSGEGDHSTVIPLGRFSKRGRGKRKTTLSSLYYPFYQDKGEWRKEKERGGSSGDPAQRGLQKEVREGKKEKEKRKGRGPRSLRLRRREEKSLQSPDLFYYIYGLRSL